MILHGIARLTELTPYGVLSPQGDRWRVFLFGPDSDSEFSRSDQLARASFAAMLKSLLTDRGQTQLPAVAVAGIANSTLSNVQHGKRQLTRDHIRRLAKHFKVDPGVFHGWRAVELTREPTHLPSSHLGEISADEPCNLRL